MKAIPDKVWAAEVPARVLDLSNNAIQEVPVKIGSLKIQVNKSFFLFLLFVVNFSR